MNLRGGEEWRNLDSASKLRWKTVDSTSAVDIDLTKPNSRTPASLAVAVQSVELVKPAAVTVQPAAVTSVINVNGHDISGYDSIDSRLKQLQEQLRVSQEKLRLKELEDQLRFTNEQLQLQVFLSTL